MSDEEKVDFKEGSDPDLPENAPDDRSDTELAHGINMFADSDGDGSAPAMATAQAVYDSTWISEYFWGKNNPHGADEWFGFDSKASDAEQLGGYERGIGVNYSGLYIHDAIQEVSEGKGSDTSKTVWGKFYQNGLAILNAASEPSGTESFKRSVLDRIADDLTHFRKESNSIGEQLFSDNANFKPGNEKFEGEAAKVLAEIVEGVSKEFTNLGTYVDPAIASVEDATEAARSYIQAVISAWNNWINSADMSPRMALRNWWEDARGGVTRENGTIHINGMPTDQASTWQTIEKEVKDRWWSNMEDLRAAAGGRSTVESKYTTGAENILPFIPVNTQGSGGDDGGSGDSGGNGGNGDFDIEKYLDNLFGGGGDGDNGGGSGGNGGNGDFDIEKYLDNLFGGGDGGGSGGGGDGGSGGGGDGGNGPSGDSRTPEQIIEDYLNNQDLHSSGDGGGGPGGGGPGPQIPEGEGSLGGNGGGDGGNGPSGQGPGSGGEGPPSSSGEGSLGGGGGGGAFVPPPVGAGGAGGGAGGGGGATGGRRDREGGPGSSAFPEGSGNLPDGSGNTPGGSGQGPEGSGELQSSSSEGSTGQDQNGSLIPPPPSQVPTGSGDLDGLGGNSSSGGGDLSSSSDSGGPGESGGRDVPLPGGSSGSGSLDSLGGRETGGAGSGDLDPPRGLDTSGLGGSSGSNTPESGGSEFPGSGGGDRPSLTPPPLSSSSGEGSSFDPGADRVEMKASEGSGEVGPGSDARSGGAGGQGAGPGGTSALGAFGGGPGTGSVDGQSGDQGQGGSQGTAGQGGAGGTPGMPMAPMMPPGGGAGGGAGGGGGQERSRSTWLAEDERVWGTSARGGPASLGRPGTVRDTKGVVGSGHVPAGADGEIPRTAAHDTGAPGTGKRKPGVGYRRSRVEGPDGQRDGERQRRDR